MSFSERLKEERKRLKLTQTELATAGGVVKKSQVVYESGKGASPSADYLEKIASIGVDVQYLLTGIRSEVALNPEERMALTYFRGAEPSIRKAALAVLISGGANQGITVRGNITGGIVAHTVAGNKIGSNLEE